jgi:hypothetical protein
MLVLCFVDAAIAGYEMRHLQANNLAGAYCSFYVDQTGDHILPLKTD